MTERPDDTDHSENCPVKRRPYEPPRVVSEEVMERMALACDPPQEVGCQPTEPGS